MTDLPPSQIKKELGPLIEGEIIVDEISRYLLSTDGSFYKIVPIAVAYPKNEQDVIEIVNYCRLKGLSIHPRGGGSGLGGQSLGKGIVLDFTKYMNKIIEINFEEQYAWVQPGVRLGELERKLREKGYFFPPDPSSRDYCTVGGNIGTNASGSHSVKYGNVSDYVESLEIVLANGELIRTGPVPVEKKEETKDLDEHAKIAKNMYSLIRSNEDIINSHYPEVKFNVSGYELRGLVKEDFIDLTRVFVGSEGTLGVVVKAKLKFLKAPSRTALIVAYFDDLEKAGEAVWVTLQENPSAIEIMDKTLLDLAREKYPSLDRSLPKELKYMLLIEFDGENVEELEQKAQILTKKLTVDRSLAFKVASSTDPKEQKLLWETRRAAVPLLYKLNLGGRKIVGFIEDGAVPPKTLPKYMNSLYKISQKYDIPMAIYGHASKGLLHVRPFVNLKDPSDLEKMEAIMVEVAETIWGLKGTVSGEHGDGRVRSFLLKQQYGPLFDVFEEVKRIFDPYGVFNPEIKTGNKQNKMIVPGETRYGSDYEIKFLPDFQLSWEENEFVDVVETCHGCSKCTTVTNVVRMCPVYKQIREEYAAPKSKANVWRGIISGELVPESMGLPIFKQIMFDCVGCQSCYLECPSNVNIPKLALEGKAQVVKEKGLGLREKLLSSFGSLGNVVSSFAPIINFFSNLSLSRWFVEKTLKITRHRELPRFKRKSFIKTFRKTHGEELIPTNNPVRKVVYFVGCSANLVDPEIAESLVSVLRKNNVAIAVPKQNCCGVPMLANGDVERAKKYVRKNLEGLVPYVRQGYDVVVTCSSCGLALKQEWNDLLGTEETKLIAENTYHFSEYLLRLKEEGLLNKDFSPVETSLGYHWSCHLKAQKSAKDKSFELLKLIPGVKVEPIDEGCCGIAGTWGYKKENYELSLKIGSGLINKLSSENIEYGATDCPTCKLQMEHGAKKKVLHPVQILASAYEGEKT